MAIMSEARGLAGIATTMVAGVPHAIAACSLAEPADRSCRRAAEADRRRSGFHGSTAAASLLATAEVEAAMGETTGPPVRLAEDVNDTSDARCSWRGVDGRELIIGGASEGGPERIAAIEPYTAADIPGAWEQARLEGCCILHAVQGQVLGTLDFSKARIELAQATVLMNAALGRVHDPLEPLPSRPSASPLQSVSAVDSICLMPRRKPVHCGRSCSVAFSSPSPALDDVLAASIEPGHRLASRAASFPLVDSTPGRIAPVAQDTDGP